MRLPGGIVVERDETRYARMDAEQTEFIESGGRSELAHQQTRVRREIGSTGTLFFGGIIVDDYNADLQGDQGLDTWQKMAKSDPTCRALEKAITLPIRGAVAQIVPPSDDPEEVEIAEFVEHNMFGMTQAWDSTLRQILLHLRYGRYVFEKIFQMYDGRIAWRKWAPRIPKSIFRWYFDETGGVAGLVQYAPKVTKATAKLGVIPTQEFEEVDIPISALLLFVNDQEGSNFDGESIFRPAYKPWWYKQNIERIMAIGVERREVGVEYAKMKPESRKEDEDAVALALETLHAHEQGYFLIPDTVEEFGITGAAPGRINSMDLLRYMDRQIALTGLAEFLSMGGDSSGSLAMHRDKSSFFLLALRAVANTVQDVINRHAIKQLVDLNYGPREEYPRLQFSRLETREVKEYAEAIVALAGAGFLSPTEVDEVAVRHELDLPDAPEREDEDEDDELPIRDPLEEFEGGNPDRPRRQAAMARRAQWRGSAMYARRTRTMTRAEMQTDFAAIETELDGAVLKIGNAAGDIRTRQAEKLAEVAQRIVETGDIDRLQRVEVPLLGELAGVIGSVLGDLYRFGQRSVRQQIQQKRGPEVKKLSAKAYREFIDPSDREDVARLLAARGRSVSQALNLKLKQALDAAVLDAIRRGTFDPAAFRAHLTALSHRDLLTSARRIVTEALNLGRQAEADRLKDFIERAEYSSLLDAGTCAPCGERDGNVYELGSDAYEANRPPLTLCEGGGQCRCVYVFVLAAEGSFIPPPTPEDIAADIRRAAKRSAAAAG